MLRGGCFSKMSVTVRTIVAADGDDAPTQLTGSSGPAVVTITGPIDKDLINPFRVAVTQASATGQPVLPILISSPGGSVVVATQMADIIDSVDIPVATVALGQAASAAAFLLTAVGTRGLRYASPGARIMFHEVSSGTSGKISRQGNSVDEGEVLNEILMDRINVMVGSDTARAGTDWLQTLIASRGHLDLFFSAQEAASEEFGFVDHARLPKMLFDPREGTFLFDGMGSESLSAFKRRKQRDVRAVKEDLFPVENRAQRKAQLVRRITDNLGSLSFEEVQDLHRQVRDQVGDRAALKARLAEQA